MKNTMNFLQSFRFSQSGLVKSIHFDIIKYLATPPAQRKVNSFKKVNIFFNFKFFCHMAERRTLAVKWYAINGAANGKRKLILRLNDNNKFTCPVTLCLHADFKSARGLRKHIDNCHPWYYYFDKQSSVVVIIAQVGL